MPLHILLLTDAADLAGEIETRLRAGGMPCRIDRTANANDFEAALGLSGWNLILIDPDVSDDARLSVWHLARRRCPDVPTLVFDDDLDDAGLETLLTDDLGECLTRARPGRWLPLIRRALVRAGTRNMLQLVLDTAPLRIFWKGLDGRYLGCNVAFAADAGVAAPSDLIGREDSEFAWRAHAEDYRSDDRAVMISGVPKLGYEEPLIWHDGREGWLRTSKVPMRNAAGKIVGVLGMYEDITESKRVHEALRRYEFIVNAVEDMMSVLNRAHRYEAVNDRWCAALGRAREETLGRHLSDVWGERVYAEAIAPRLEQCFARGKPVLLEATLDFPGRGGRICSIAYYPYSSAPGEIEYAIVVTRDVTERMRAEQALRASEARLRGVLDGAVDGIVVIDGAGRIESFNLAAERIFGYRAGEVLGANVNMLMPEPYHSAHDGYLRRFQQTGEARIIGIGREVTGRRKDGGEFPMDLAVSLMRIGEERRYTGIVRDITLRKAAERELMQARDAAEAASRAKSEFLSNMSHELRTPMNAILGFAQLLEMEGALLPGQRDSVQEIMKAGRHLLELINEVLDLARVESGQMRLDPETIPPAELIDECVALVGPDAQRRGIDLGGEASDCAGHGVLADRLRLKQVLLNLLSNAVKYNRDGGSARITCNRAQPGWARIAVTDTGVGIDSEKQAELFMAFHRLGQESGSIEGTGIGLAISKRLVELMGGRIGVESQPGQGSTFWVELPAAPRVEAAPQPAGAPAVIRGAPAVGSCRHAVLYIEDNAANLRLVEQILGRRPDLCLLGAARPALGLELARRERPDLILLDINLPDLDGYEVLRQLRQAPSTAAIPVVAISANAMPQDVEQGLAAGFVDYLTKPLDIVRLRAVVDRILDGGRDA